MTREIIDCNNPDHEYSGLNTRARVVLICEEGSSLTDSSPEAKQQADMNYIVEKFQSTGQLPWNAMTGEQVYGDAPTLDLKGALDLVFDARSEFSELDSITQEMFNNSPDEYFNFLDNYSQNPADFEPEISGEIEGGTSSSSSSDSSEGKKAENT